MTNHQNRKLWAIDQKRRAYKVFAAKQAQRDAEQKRLALIIMYQSILIGALR